MNWRISLLICLFFVLHCKEEGNELEYQGKDLVKPPTYRYLIEIEEFLLKPNGPGIKIIDFRKPELYAQEHIPNAINIWRAQIEDTLYPYGGMMAPKQQIETLFSQLGITSSDTLIVYDDNGLSDASRLWWVLQNYDFDQIRLLHGGLKNYKLKGGKTTKEIRMPIKSSFALPDKSSMKYVVSKEDIINSMNSNIILIDSRSDDEFSGKRQKAGAHRGGRIPSSIQVEWAHTIDYYGDKRFKNITDLKNIYNKIADVNDSVIVYCHSGVRSAHTTFVLTQLLGYMNVRNYDGSWTEWSYHRELPIEKDSATTILN